MIFRLLHHIGVVTEFFAGAAEAQGMGDQLQQVVSRPDQGTVVTHPSTLADIERIRNDISPSVRQSR